MRRTSQLIEPSNVTARPSLRGRSATTSSAGWMRGPWNLVGVRSVPKVFASAFALKEPRYDAKVPWHRDHTNVPPRTTCNLSLILDDWASDCGEQCWVHWSQRLPNDVDPKTAPQSSNVASEKVAGDGLLLDVRLIQGLVHNTSGSRRRKVVIEYCPSLIVGP